jgi:predicted nucleic acid-binding protein
LAAVSNTSPLRYFVVIGLADLLPEVLGPIVIPQGVHSELSHPSAPAAVRKWLAAKPAWLSVKIAGEPDVELSASLDRGEAEAITLALETRPDFLLMDERKGRRLAEERGLAVIGALGVLLEASRRGLVDQPLHVLDQLKAAGFRASGRLVDEFVARLK